MKILFLTNTTKYFTTRATHGIMYLSAALKNAGHQVNAADLNMEGLQTDIESFKPDVIAYSVMSCNYPPVKTINQILKKTYDFTAVFGGPHATYFPEIIHDEGVDAVCRGEGDEAFVEFVDRLERGENFQDTRNFWVRQGKEITKNPLRSLIEDLDSLPFPDRSLFLDRFWDLRENPVKTFHTSRGCPLSCGYCHNDALKKMYKGHGKMVRMRSVDNVVREIESVKNQYPLQFVRFFSDVFFLKEDWLEEFAVQYSKRIVLPFWCLITPTQVNEQVVQYLKKAGCWSVGMGIEAGDETVRRTTLNRPISDQKIHDALKILTDSGIHILTYNIMGIPGSGLENDLKFLGFNIPYKVAYPMATMMTPFPGTRVYEEAKKHGVIPDEHISYDNSMMRVSPLDIPDREKTERLQKLLAIVVRFQFLNRFLPTLMKLPLDGFYWLLYKAWMGYAFSRKIFPNRPSWKFTLLTAKRFIFGFQEKGVLNEGILKRTEKGGDLQKQ